MTLHVAPEGSVAGGGWLQGFSVSGHAIHSKQPDKQRGSSCTPGGGLLGGRLDPASGTPGRSRRVPLGFTTEVPPPQHWEGFVLRPREDVGNRTVSNPWGHPDPEVKARPRVRVSPAELQVGSTYPRRWPKAGTGFPAQRLGCCPQRRGCQQEQVLSRKSVNHWLLCTEPGSPLGLVRPGLCPGPRTSWAVLPRCAQLATGGDEGQGGLGGSEGSQDTLDEAAAARGSRSGDGGCRGCDGVSKHKAGAVCLVSGQGPPGGARNTPGGAPASHPDCRQRQHAWQAERWPAKTPTSPSPGL